MKAMVLAAGLGTRLRPLTDDRPKALVEIDGRTLLEIALERLRAFGVTDVIINVHHFADMIVQYLAAKQNFGMRIEISREDILLDTGGGLKKAAWFFLEGSHDEPFLLHNVDVLSNIDLGRWCNFTRSTMRWPLWPFRSARVLATCCSMTAANFAVAASSAKIVPSWPVQPSRCSRWRSAAFT